MKPQPRRGVDSAIRLQELRMAVRPSWQGHLRLSLVTHPAALYPATTEAAAVRFDLMTALRSSLKGDGSHAPRHGTRRPSSKQPRRRSKHRQVA